MLPKLQDDVCEHWLFHGSTKIGVQGISDTDFNIDLAGTHRGTLYGNGAYLAECSTRRIGYLWPTDPPRGGQLLVTAAASDDAVARRARRRDRSPCALARRPLAQVRHT